MHKIGQWMLDIRCWILDVGYRNVRTVFGVGYKVVYNVLIGGGCSLPLLSRVSLCSFFTPLKSPFLNNNFRQIVSYICQLCSLSTPLIKTTKLNKLNGVI
jgi:hypothetical protein